MSNMSVEVNPKILTQGGFIDIHFPFVKDPFSYQESDFLINNSPLKLAYMTDKSFRGEVTQPLETHNNPITIKLNTKTKAKSSVFVPEIIISQFHQLENNIFLDQDENFIFLDSKKIGDTYSPILYKYHIINDSLEKIPLPNYSINSIFVDRTNRIFASSTKDKVIYLLDEQSMELNQYAQGLGAPFGMVCNKKNDLFVADQKGSLFLVKEKSSLFISDIPISYKGYYLAVSPKTDDIYISTPHYAGKNSIVAYRKKSQTLEPITESYNLLGAIAFDNDNSFYWVEHTRQESIVYQQQKDTKIKKLISGQFFMGLCFNKEGDLYINDLHTIYKIDKGYLYD